jgi:hypothetical protein
MPASDPSRPGDGASPEDAWADIVANYGERAVLEPEAVVAPEPPAPAPPVPEPMVSHVFGDDVDEEPAWEDDDDILLPGSFVAPDPGPVGWSGWRSMAWVGVLGSPALALVWTLIVQITDWVLPELLAYALVGTFLGSFGYLVATMPKDKDDPWDDGARV